MDASLQSLAAAMATLASAQTILAYTLVVLTVGTLVGLGLLARVTIDIHRQTNKLLRRSERGAA